MADKTLELIKTYPSAEAPTLDHAYSETEREIRWAVAMQDPDINPAAESGPAGGTPEQVAAAGKAAEQPSAIATGVKTALEAAGEGARNAMEGLTRTILTRPQGGANTADEVARGLADKVGGVRQLLIDGLLPIVGAPLIGLGAGARQALKNQNAALEQQVVTEDGGFIRMILGGGNPLDPTLEGKALRGPMTVGEALDIAVQSAPLAAGAAGKVVKAAKIQAPNLKGERGSAAFRSDDAGGPGGTIPQPPEAAKATRAVGELNVDRIEAPDTVKSIMLRLNQMAGEGERMQAHREVVSHEATIAAGKARGVNLERLMNTDLESYLPDAAGQDALRNMYTAVGHVLDSLEQRIAMGDKAAQAEYISTQAIGMVLAVLDEAGARNVARSLEARKIGSEAERASMKDLASFARKLGVETGLTPEVDAGKSVAARAKAAGLRVVKEGHTPDETFSVADLVAGKIGGELTLTTVAAELIRTAHGGKAPAKISAAEAIAAKITAELQAQQPHVGPEALMGVYKAIERAQRAAEDAQVREHDAVAVTIANALAASGYTKPPTAMSLAEAVARKMALELLAAPQTEQGASPAAILAAMRAHLETEHQRRTWQGNWWAGIRAGASIAYSAWIQGLISGIKTSTRNILGMAVSLPYEAPSRFTAEWVNKFITHDPDGVQRGETARALSQSVGAIGSAIQLMGQAWRENKAPFEEAARARSKVKILLIGEKEGPNLNTGKAGRVDNSAAAWGFDPETTFGGTIDVLNKALNSRWTPGGALIVEDAFAQGIAYHMEMSALAVRTATREGLTSGSPEYLARVKALETSPLPHMVIDAQDHAILITMNKELGATGQLALRLMDRIPGARVLVPFVRWGTNAAKFVVQNTGLLGELSMQNWRDLNPAGGNWGTAGAEAAARDKAIARMILGAGTTTAIVAAVLNGTITPSGMLSPAQRALKPFREEGSDYAIRLGNTLVSGYNQWGGQVGLMVAAIADYVDLLRHIPNQAAMDKWTAGLEGIVIASGFTFVRQSSMQGLANMLDAIQDPERSSGKELKGLARSAVPTLVRDVTKTFDDNVIHEVRTLSDAFKAGLPYFAQGIPAHRHPVTGEVLVYPAAVAPEFLWPLGAFVNMVTPIGFTGQKDRAWAKEVLANEVLLRPIGWNISLHGFTTQAPNDGPQLTERPETGSVEMTAVQRDNAIVYMTQTAKDSHGRTLPEALEHLVHSEQYRKQSGGADGGRATRLRQVYGEFRDRAHAWLMDPTQGSPTLRAKVLDAQRAKDNAKRPVTDPKSPQFNPATLLQSLGR